MPSLVGFVPARSGSKRIPGKNIRVLRGHPLLAYTIAAALDSGVFDVVILSTDSEEVAEIGSHYGAEVPFLRPAEYAADRSTDFDWLNYTVGRLAAAGRSWDSFSILRPTSPFRNADTIRRAWEQFTTDPIADSLRAVELCAQHPGKMWVVDGNRMRPLLASSEHGTAWHSSPYQSLPPVYAQNASLEIAWTKTLLEQQSIAGTLIIPFFTTGFEGLDVNQPRDWWYVEELLRRGEVELPTVAAKPWSARQAGRRKGEGGRGPK